MATRGKREVTVLWDREGDILEVIWQGDPGTFEPIEDDDRVLERIDNDGNTLGFMIMGVSSMEGFPARTFTLGQVRPSRNVTARRAAQELGVSATRLRQLLAQGRVKGAERIGRDWVIPLPVEIVPGSRGPIGVAGKSEGAAG